VTSGDRYRARALELLSRADCETNSQTRAEFENLAAAFQRLAEQAERNTKLVIEFELPPDKPAQS
jgi:CO/xanthine dehydrogenase FAD-binding subunit